ncbi:hypothetical protein D9Q98_000827 [Chlorella vulgaris]|uniref:Uncharacterized protein n=1 Tax=Chlorella vulgaris TaxID=3077 RepID=A0A9D4TYU5_CHLVU|nr:hypothetical protein D9Q98_000827 [Chlorella vulgaris]
MQLRCAAHAACSQAATGLAGRHRAHVSNVTWGGQQARYCGSHGSRLQQLSGGSQRRQQCAAAAAALDGEVSGVVDEDEDEEQEVINGDLTRRPSNSASSTTEEEEGADESREFVLAMAKVAWETKGEDILVLHVAPVVYWTRYFLIATVFSRPQLNAVLGKMTKEAAEVFDRRLSASPQAGPGGWELLDYGDVVVHVMTADQREYYDLESFYGAAEEVDLPFDTEATVSDVDTWSKTF